MTGYFGIGIEHCKSEENIGTLWRSAYNLGAAYIFTIGRRYHRQASDTTKTWRSIPLFEYSTFEEFKTNTPYNSTIVGVEFPHEKSRPIANFSHPDRCAYVLGAEDHGLKQTTLAECHHLIYIPSRICMNVAVAGSIVMYDRQFKRSDHARLFNTG